MTGSVPQATHYRTDHDSLGDVRLPAMALYGAQTARALENFPISGIPISHFPALIRAIGQVKRAAATANLGLGLLSREKADAIVVACDEIIAGKLDQSFPVDVFQGGAGTSTNMNANEVIANRANELLGHARGSYGAIHPNNDVNLSQSTNDVYPTAIRLAILSSKDHLSRAIAELADAMNDRALAFSGVRKLGRTQLQDAVPMSLGQEFAAFATTLREDLHRLDEIVRHFREVNLGGTAIGTGINADPRYHTAVVAELSRVTGLALEPAGDLIEACWDTGAFVLFSGMLKRTATKLSKIANDLRLLASGPRGGLAEIVLPARQPGSSIMPGKVNPVIPEVVNQVAFYVIGADLTVTMAAEAGQLQLNAMEPVIAYSILQSMTLMTNAIDTLTVRCVRGIGANRERCEQTLDNSTAGVTALVPLLGYERSAQIALEALRSGRSLAGVIATLPETERLLIQANGAAPGTDTP